MKPIVQVPLAILLVAVLVFIMYSQSQKNAEEEKAASDPVENGGVVGAEQTQADEEGAASAEEAAAYDAITDDVADDAQDEQQSAPQKQASKDQVKRASVSLRERRRNMFKKIDVGVKDDLASKEEHDRFFGKAFNFYDKNDDGRLTGKEQNQVKRLPRKADVNKDGILTRKEFLDQFDRFFAIMDKDKSGDLTEEEFVR